MKIRLPSLSCMTLSLAFVIAIPAVAADVAPMPTSTTLVAGLSAEEIVERMRQRNELRALDLHAYESTRSYSLSYRGFPSDREAQEEVVVYYTAPESKSFDDCVSTLRNVQSWTGAG